MSRRSARRSTLAVLREELGLTQGELGKLIDLSRPTIQAIELGKLRLTESNAAGISAQTGVSASWLLDGDPEKPMVADPTFSSRPYRRQFFETIQATFNAYAQRALKGHADDRDAWSIELCSEWFGVLAAARKAGQQEIAEYLLSRFIDQMKKRFGYDAKGKRRVDSEQASGRKVPEGHDSGHFKKTRPRAF
jgi:DNA-binding XRE family transcriptional regulator